MALVPQSMVVDTAGPGSGKRAFPEGPGAVQGGVFASGSGTLAHLTPLTKNGSGNYIMLDDDATDGTQNIAGFVWSIPGHTLSGSGETMCEVFKAGRIHIDDIPIVTGYTKAGIIALAQRGQLRELGIVIEGIKNQGGPTIDLDVS